MLPFACHFAWDLLRLAMSQIFTGRRLLVNDGRWGRLLLVAMLTICFVHCESAISKRTRTRLAEHAVIAVVDVEVKVIGSESMLNNTFQSVLDKIGLNLNVNQKRDNLRDRFREHSIQTLNQRLSMQGMQPIQRRRIQAILKELALSQAGLTESSLKIGKLARARSVFTGTLTIREKKGAFFIPDGIGCLGSWSGSVEVLFSGEITSVERGEVLYADTVYRQGNSFSMRIVEDVLADWFEKMPVVEG